MLRARGGSLNIAQGTKGSAAFIIHLGKRKGTLSFVINSKSGTTTDEKGKNSRAPKKKPLPSRLTKVLGRKLPLKSKEHVLPKVWRRDKNTRTERRISFRRQWMAGFTKWKRNKIHGAEGIVGAKEGILNKGGEGFLLQGE